MSKPAFQHFRRLMSVHGLKLASLVLATVAWYGIREAINNESEVSDIPISIVHDEGWAVMSLTPETVDVRFQGARSDLAALTRDNVSVVVDVRGKKTPGRVFTMDLGAHHVVAARGCRVVTVNPRRISFSLDREGERAIPVKAELQGGPMEGFEVTRVTCDPPTVMVRGPMAGLSQMEHVLTQPLDMEGRLQSFRTRVSLGEPSGTPGMRFEPDRVQVFVELTEHTENLILQNVIVQTLGRPGSAAIRRVEPAVVAVTLAGRPVALGKLRPGDLQAFVDTTAMEAGQNRRVPVQVAPPAGMHVISIDPAEVAVTAGP